MANLFFILSLFSLLALILGLFRPKLVIRWGTKRTRGRVLLIYGLAMIGFLIVAVVTVPPDSAQVGKKGEQKTADSSKKEIQQAKVTLPKYIVLDKDIYDAPVKTQVTMNILVSGEISELGLRALLNRLYSEIKTKKGFKYHDSPTNIYIYAFTSRDRAESGMGQWIAMLLKSYDDKKPSISINERQITALGVQPKVKFGLTEKERKQIWSELVETEDRATEESEQKYPLPDPSKLGYSQSAATDQLKKQAELNSTLTERYKNELAKKYGLTREQLNEIAVEGFTKDWPFPKLQK